MLITEKQLLKLINIIEQLRLHPNFSLNYTKEYAEYIADFLTEILNQQSNQLKEIN